MHRRDKIQKYTHTLSHHLTLEYVPENHSLWADWVSLLWCRKWQCWYVVGMHGMEAVV